jgi:hypothetical protein
MRRFTFEQRENFRRACHLNRASCFSDLRRLYRACLDGAVFGRYSGYRG